MQEIVTSMVGLVGVVVGGGITYLTQRRLERVQERRDREREMRQVTAVTRLIRDDLYRAQTAVADWCLSNRSWWPGNPMRTDPSPEELKLIAGLLDWERWASFSHGVGVFRELSLRRDNAKEQGMDISDGDLVFAQFATEALDGARAAISALTGGEYSRHRPQDKERNHPEFTRELVKKGHSGLPADSGARCS